MRCEDEYGSTTADIDARPRSGKERMSLKGKRERSLMVRRKGARMIRLGGKREVHDVLPSAVPRLRSTPQKAFRNAVTVPICRIYPLPHGGLA